MKKRNIQKTVQAPIAFIVGPIFDKKDHLNLSGTFATKDFAEELFGMVMWQMDIITEYLV